MAEPLKGAKVLPAGPLEVLQLALCVAGRNGALEALVGRRATPAQLDQIGREFTQEIVAATELLAKDPLVSNRDLVEAARASGAAAVARVLGPLQPAERH